MAERHNSIDKLDEASYRIKVGHRTVSRAKSKENAIRLAENHVAKQPNKTVLVIDPRGLVVWEHVRKRKS